MKTTTVLVANIKYDTELDGITYSAKKLPKTFKFVFDSIKGIDLEQRLSDLISENTGWCVESFTYKIK